MGQIKDFYPETKGTGEIKYFIYDITGKIETPEGQKDVTTIFVASCRKEVESLARRDGITLLAAVRGKKILSTEQSIDLRL